MSFLEVGNLLSKVFVLSFKVWDFQEELFSLSSMMWWWMISSQACWKHVSYGFNRWAARGRILFLLLFFWVFLFCVPLRFGSADPRRLSAARSCRWFEGVEILEIEYFLFPWSAFLLCTCVGWCLAQRGFKRRQHGLLVSFLATSGSWRLPLAAVISLHTKWWQSFH